MGTIGKLVKEARVKAGLSQEDLAKKIFVTKQSISKYENGHAEPSLEIKKLLEEVLNIDLTMKAKSSQGLNRIFVITFAVLMLIGLVTTSIISIRTNHELALLQSQNEELTGDYDLLNSNYNNVSNNYSQLQSDYSSQSDSLNALIIENEALTEELSDIYDIVVLTINGFTINCDKSFIRINDEYIAFKVTAYNHTDSPITIYADLLSTDIKNGGLWLGDGYDTNDYPLGSSNYRSEIEAGDSEVFILTIHNRKAVEPAEDYLLLDKVVVYYQGEVLTVIDIPKQI